MIEIPDVGILIWETGPKGINLILGVINIRQLSSINSPVSQSFLFGKDHSSSSQICFNYFSMETTC